MESKRPQGVLIVGIINIVFFGLGSLGGIMYLQNNPQEYNEMLSDALGAKSVISSQMNNQFIKIVSFLQGVFALLFIISGIGVLLRREWARTLALYFSFAIVLLVFLLVLFQPSLIKQAFMQIVYPGILIMYFTNSKIVAYFRQR
ncbi:MAG: hypothetical protein JSW40_06080 [Candidatus Omnitrophota bacterium]|nr:MAG: hypothetical protein JSW40_06080 [Candidatus Omnitrophota bacterium]